MQEKIEKALNEMYKAIKESNALRNVKGLGINDSKPSCDSKTVLALIQADAHERLAKVTYYTLFFADQGRNKKWVDDFLKDV